MEQGSKLNKKGDTRGMNNKLTSANRGKQNAKLNKVQKDELTEKVINWMVDGYSNIQITKLIQEHSPVELSQSNAFNVLYYARDVLEEITKEDVGTAIILHIGIYEEGYHYFKSIDNVPGMNRALKCKEDLVKLGVQHTVNVNQNKTTIIEKEVVYNLNKLTPEEQKELQELSKIMEG
jgi:hypothetical protein